MYRDRTSEQNQLEVHFFRIGKVMVETEWWSLKNMDYNKNV